VACFDIYKPDSSTLFLKRAICMTFMYKPDKEDACYCWNTRWEYISTQIYLLRLALTCIYYWISAAVSHHSRGCGTRKVRHYIVSHGLSRSRFVHNVECPRLQYIMCQMVQNSMACSNIRWQVRNIHTYFTWVGECYKILVYWH
jgi:hypothetical protein